MNKQNVSENRVIVVEGELEVSKYVVKRAKLGYEVFNFVTNNTVSTHISFIEAVKVADTLNYPSKL